MYAWVKALHIVSMVAWFAGLFYLPRLFVYHATTDDEPGRTRFKIMERKLYRGIMTPSALVTVALGVGLIALRGAEWFRQSGWLHVKLVLVSLLLIYHVYLGRLVYIFAIDANRHSQVYYRWLNEAPVLVLVGATVLAVVQPF